MTQVPLVHLLNSGLERALREMNPWWRGEPVPQVPPVRRWAFNLLLHRLRQGPAPFVLLRGPRRVGKTVLQLHVIDEMLRADVNPKRILRLQLDDLPALRNVAMPILEIAYWFADNILGKSFGWPAATWVRLRRRVFIWMRFADR